MESMFGLTIGQILTTTSRNGDETTSKTLPITQIRESYIGDNFNGWWASLGEITNGLGERELLISVDGKTPCWENPNWIIILK
jgi:hypothetical protein